MSPDPREADPLHVAEEAVKVGAWAYRNGYRRGRNLSKVALLLAFGAGLLAGVVVGRGL